MKTKLFSRAVFAAITLAAASVLLIAAQTMNQAAEPDNENQPKITTGKVYRFDFGAAEVDPNSIAVGPDKVFSDQVGYGWLKGGGLQGRDRGGPDALRRDFVFGGKSQTFRLTGLQPGLYKVTILSGDLEFGNHSTQVRIGDKQPDLPILEPTVAEFATLTVTAKVEASTLDISFGSPFNNWAVNALTVEAATQAQAPSVTQQRFAQPAPKSAWMTDVPADPTLALLERFEQAATSEPPNFRPTGLQRADYVKLIASEVDFWKGHQDDNGAIIDPYRKAEFQYSTPAFAHAAAFLVDAADRKDLLEPAAKAMDWATSSLSQRKAATRHEDFYPPLLAHALPLLKPRVTAARAARWEAEIRDFDPLQTYRNSPGSNNWNVVALSGEALFQQMGLRKSDSKYVEDSLAGQGKFFRSPYGLYLEGPMSYDHFPRLWLADLIAHDYSGPYRAELTEMLRRAAVTSLFMQSPWGELPAGGRSAHHQWNEAEQCVTYEVFAARALRDKDTQLAQTYKRAAHLALASMLRWVRPSGEMQIVKNWVDPAATHAYEGYSSHSQYNLLPMAMLALAYENAATTEQLAERPAPADVGGFVLEIPHLHKVFANAGGAYVETDTNGDHHYDATGLIRIHFRAVSPQLGPSDSIVEKPSYRRPADSPTTTTTGVGVAWKDAEGAWRRLGELDKSNLEQVKVENVRQAPDRVSYDIVYQGKLFGVSRIVEHYVVTPQRVELTTELTGYNGPLRYVWPVLADDGRTKSTITVTNGTVSVSQDGGKTAQTFTPLGADSVQVEAERYANHNGWARLGVADYSKGGKITLVIAPKGP